MTEAPDNVIAFPVAASSRFRFISSDAFLDRDPPRWLVKGVLPEAGLGVIYGASGAGKSFFALDLLASVAMGSPWRGRKTRRTKVAYVAAEGAGGFRNRIDAYAQNKAVLGNRLVVMAAAPNFLLEDDVTEVIEILKAEEPGIVCVDTLAQVTPGGDENSATDMGNALGHCRQIHEETGALVILIHHAGKDASRGARGWSGIRAACDVEIEVSGGDLGRVARLTKQKDGEDGIEFPFKLVPVDIGMDDDGDVITSCIVEETEREIATTRGRRQLTPKEQIVFDALGRSIDRHGLSAPAEIPDDVRPDPEMGPVSGLFEWRAEAIASLADPETKPDTARRNFGLIKDRLQAAGIVGVWGDWAWLK